jgi:serine/threonine-protein kinase
LPTADVLAVESTAIAGTPLYLSPEALQGATPDPRVDLWALAVVVLEAIAGTYPFQARDPVEVVRRLRRGGKPDWSQWRALVTPEVAELFDRALSPHVEQRPQSAAAFAVQLRAVQSRLRAEGAA